MLRLKGSKMSRLGYAWYIKFPLDAYALGPVRFKEPKSQQAVRKWAREWAKVKRLPMGFECWIADKD